MIKVSLAAAVAAWRSLQNPTFAELEANPVTKGLNLSEAVTAHIESLLPNIPATILFEAYYQTRIADLSATINANEEGAKRLRKLAAKLERAGHTEAAIELLAALAEELGIAVKGGRVASASKSEKKEEKKAKKVREEEEEPEAPPKPPKKEKSEKKADKKEKKDKKSKKGGDPEFAARMAKKRAEKKAQREAEQAE